jgi:hypothetical protein
MNEPQTHEQPHAQPPASTQPMVAAPPPPASSQVEPCRECGAPLAADQRYCLNCGRRRGEARIDFRQHLPAPEVAANHEAGASGHTPATLAVASPETALASEQKPQRDYTPLAAAGGIAVLGLMLLVGVLIGRGDGNQAAAPPPQVVRVQGGGEETTAGNEGAAAQGDAGAKKAKAKGSGKGGALTGGSGKAPPAEITASDSELEALQGKSPQEYSEAAAKLPDEIATPGKAPPTDNKAPGGGSKGTAIE